MDRNKKYSLQEIYEFIPNCIICGKNLNFLLTYFDKSNSLNRFHLKIEDGNLVSIKSKTDLKINIASSSILSDNSLMNISHNLHFLKSCSTCNFKIDFYENSYVTSKMSNFILNQIKFDCFLKGNRTLLFIDNLIGNPFIWLNNKTLSTENIEINIDKIKNLKQLNKLINMIATFS